MLIQLETGSELVMQHARSSAQKIIIQKMRALSSLHLAPTSFFPLLICTTAKHSYLSDTVRWNPAFLCECAHLTTVAVD